MTSDKLTSILIPARNEEFTIMNTLNGIIDCFQLYKKSFEIDVIIDDGCDDGTERVLASFVKENSHVRVIKNEGKCGLGNAIQAGLDQFKGDWVIITMADGSDNPLDMISYVKKMEEGYDCCFGSRWMQKGLTHNYPGLKRLLNRFVNLFIQLLYGIGYSDTTNAFKCYSRNTILGIKPIISHHFNIAVELPIKAIIRGYSYAVVPTSWFGREVEASNLRIKSMGSRYIFILLYLWLEKFLSKGDYKKR